MENRIITAVFKGSKNTKVSDVWQWDYGQTLRIQGLDLPTAVEVDFAVAGASESIARIGTTKDGVTDVVIPDSLIETGKNLVAYIYLRDSASGNTEYQIDMLVTKRAKPEAYDRPEDKKLFGQAIEAVNTAADRAEKAGQTATEAAGQAAEDAQQTAEDRKEVEKMVETVSDISEQVKKVEQLSQQAQDAADKTEADAQQTAEDRVEVGKMLETVKDVSEQVKSVEESVQKAKESEQAAAEHRTAVEEMKNSVEQTASTFPQTVQEGVQAIENAGTAEVQEITQAGTAQKTTVEATGTQAVQSVENVKSSATEAVETAKTEAVQAVQAEGAKQIKEVQDKGAEVLQSIPEDFATQMETKLNKQQGIENKGKVLVIGEDGNVVPGEVASGGGDGIAIINTMSGESPLVIPDSAERVNKRLELGGKTEQVQTSGKNLLPDKFSIYAEGKSKTNLKLQIGNYVYSSKTSKNLYILHEDKSNITNGWTATNKFNFKIDKEETIEIRIETENPLEILPMIREETELDSYEPYTGGKPSPSPEYPQEIKSVGKWNDEKQKYEVDVKVVGKNLFDVNYFAESENYQNKEGDATYWKYATFKVKPNTTYTVSKRKSLNVNGAINNGIYYGGALAFNNDVNSVKITTKDDGVFYVIFFYRSEDVNILKEMDIQIELGETLTEYEPYKEQTLTLTSDRPITKWDKLVEQGGEIGWLYAGVVIDRFDGQSNKISIANKQGDVQNFSIRFENVANGNGNSDIFVDKYRAVQLSYTKAEYGICCNWNDGVKYFSAPNENVATVDEFKAWLVENPLKIAYETTNPEFVPLPQSEQNAIRALKAYYPTTVITADGGELDPDIKVTYTADTKNYIDGKVSAKVASILRQYQADTANLLSLMPMETQATMIENDTNNILNNLESEEAHE
ncbi:hypothetical protein [Mediterraneibacter gnavus]|uniref:hypothetical protein n=1 Tax=Mediterraneibacter gnavus TaxID=33038 RepID=UPI0034A12334